MGLPAGNLSVSYPPLWGEVEASHLPRASHSPTLGARRAVALPLLYSSLCSVFVPAELDRLMAFRGGAGRTAPAQHEVRLLWDTFHDLLFCRFSQHRKKCWVWDVHGFCPACLWSPHTETAIAVLYSQTVLWRRLDVLGSEPRCCRPGLVRFRH